MVNFSDSFFDGSDKATFIFNDGIDVHVLSDIKRIIMVSSTSTFGVFNVFNLSSSDFLEFSSISSTENFIIKSW